MEDKIAKRNKSMQIPDVDLSEVAQQFKSIADFQAFINSQPKDGDIAVNKLVSTRPKYLPIGIIEKTLDEVYSGLWNTYFHEMKVVANEIVFVISLETFHPVAKVWLRRLGTGAAMIRMKKDSQLTDYNSKIPNALVADAPHALSEALKSAAGKFGVKFGRNLNRELGSDFSDYTTIDEQFVPANVIDEVIKQLKECMTPKAIKEVFVFYSEYKEDLSFKKLFINRNKELTKSGGKK